MIIFIHGQEEYLAQKYLNEIRKKFISKYTDLSYEVLDFTDKKYTFEEISRSIYALGFFSGKRLIVIKDFIALGGSYLQEKIQKTLSGDQKNLIWFFMKEKCLKRSISFINF